MDLQMQAFDNHLDFYLALNSYTTLRARTAHSFNQYALSAYRLQWLALSFLNLIFHFVFCSLSTFLLYGCTVM